MFHIVDQKSGKFVKSAEECIRLTEDVTDAKKFKTKKVADEYINAYLSESYFVFDPKNYFISIYHRYTYIGGGYFDITNKKSIIAYARKRIELPKKPKMTLIECSFTGTYKATFE